MIGVLALGIWLALAVALPWLWAQRRQPGRFWTIVGVAGALLVIGSAVMVEAGIARRLWHSFTGAAARRAA